MLEIIDCPLLAVSRPFSLNLPQIPYLRRLSADSVDSLAGIVQNAVRIHQTIPVFNPVSSQLGKNSVLTR